MPDAPPDLPPTSGEGDPLVAAYLGRRAGLIRFFAARTGSHAAAEDLAQELYLKVVGRSDRSEAENPAALLFRMATNLMLDRARGETRAAVREGAWSRESRARLGADEIAEEPPADEALASRQRLAQLVEAVAELPPQMQRAFRLHKLEGLSHAQTANAMGISVKSVEKHISAALKALTRRLER